VEDSLWSCFVNKANSCGFEKIVAEYLKTEKNNMVSDLFDKLGMSRTKASETEISYNLALPAVTNHPAWIQIKVKDNEQSTTAV